MKSPDILLLAIYDPKAPDFEADPTAWLMVERKESIVMDERLTAHKDRVYSASLKIHYELIYPHKYMAHTGGSFEGSYHMGYSSGDATVSLISASASEGAVFLDLPGLEGHRIGTYLMDQLVTWVKQWPDAIVGTIKLNELQALDEDSKARRNRFYERFKIPFDYFDSSQRAGESRPIPAHALSNVTTWERNIKIKDVRVTLNDLMEENKRLQHEVTFQKQLVRDRIAELRTMESKPLRWALQMFWVHHVRAPAILFIFFTALLGFFVLSGK